MDDGLRAAIEAAGGIRPLSRMLGLTHQAIMHWSKVPERYLLEIEKLTRVDRERLRPDLYRRAQD